MSFSASEYCDMLAEVQMRYTERYSNRRNPSYKVFRRFNQRLREDRQPVSSLGSCNRKTKNNVETEEAIIYVVLEVPTASVRQVY